MRHLFQTQIKIGRPLNTANRYLSTRTADPLRILFCGSEEFSVASLEALHQEQLKDKESIASIDVLCKPGKYVGRGLKKVREVPIAAVTKKLSLPLHHADTFRGWHPPTNQGEPINLVIAVSFGLLVPPRILGAAKFGGLNVHPSLLPDFRGPAPLHHTLLSGSTSAGITIQTLHPERFDHGTILSQTSVEIPKPKSITVPELTNLMAPRGAEMLVQCIRDRLFVPPLQECDTRLLYGENPALRSAPKITPRDRQILWDTWTADDILRRHRVIGPLWSLATSSRPPDAQTKRIIWPSGFHLASESMSISLTSSSVGVPVITSADGVDGAIYIKTCDGQILKADQAKAEGAETTAASHMAVRNNMVNIYEEHQADHSHKAFWSPLS